MYGLLISKGINHNFRSHAANIFIKKISFFLTLNILQDLVDTNKSHSVPKKGKYNNTKD